MILTATQPVQTCYTAQSRDPYCNTTSTNMLYSSITWSLLQYNQYKHVIQLNHVILTAIQPVQTCYTAQSHGPYYNTTSINMLYSSITWSLLQHNQYKHVIQLNHMILTTTQPVQTCYTAQSCDPYYNTTSTNMLYSSITWSLLQHNQYKHVIQLNHVVLTTTQPV